MSVVRAKLFSMYCAQCAVDTAHKWSPTVKGAMFCIDCGHCRVTKSDAKLDAFYEHASRLVRASGIGALTSEHALRAKREFYRNGIIRNQKRDAFKAAAAASRAKWEGKTA